MDDLRLLHDRHDAAHPSVDHVVEELVHALPGECAALEILQLLELATERVDLVSPYHSLLHVDLVSREHDEAPALLVALERFHPLSETLE